ncbi:MAG: MaoC family dehydratase [Rhodospirillaceae bacterium]|nr:MaoC family dehydratase [Rhodospirillaceae bacterium]
MWTPAEATALPLSPQAELAPGLAVDTARVRRPQYGRYLDDLEPGRVFAHPRGMTFDRAGMTAFARTYMQANPLYLNEVYARAHGFRDIPASPQMVFNATLSLGVQNDSEKAIANLGYYDVQFLRPVYAGDTLTAFTRVKDRQDRGPGKPGIATIQTLSVNQAGLVVLQYTRKIMVGHRPDGAVPGQPPAPGVKFPFDAEAVAELPQVPGTCPANLTGPDTYFEDFAPGDIIVHANGRTITDEHMALTYLIGNSHPLHFDRIYSTGLSGKMSGEPIVYGGLVFAWLEGLASRDTTENALWELGFTEGYHTQPAVSGDTVAALSRVLDAGPAHGALGEVAGIVTFQLIGVKGVSAAAALDTHGADLFVKENDKKGLGKEKIPAKIFEIERRVLIKRRPR